MFIEFRGSAGRGDSDVRSARRIAVAAVIALLLLVTLLPEAGGRESAATAALGSASAEHAVPAPPPSLR